jgi:hypothetical protein
MYKHGSQDALYVCSPDPRIIIELITSYTRRGCMNLTPQMMIDFDRVRHDGVDAALW